MNAQETVNFLAESEDLLSPGISACQGCMAELSLRCVLKSLGKKSIITIPPGCMAGAGVGGWNKTYGVKIPSFMPQLGNSASMLAGVKAAYNLDDPDVNVVGFCGDGATADIGFASLSAAAERKDNIIYICNDNEGYMNTGFQKSGTTPHGAKTSTTPVGKIGHGKPNFKKDVAMMMAMQDAAYVATLCPAYMEDFMTKIEKAKTIKDGMVYLHILNACPTGWGTEPEQSVEYMKRAIRSRYFLLFEYRNYEYTISAPTKNIREPLDVVDFLRGQKRFKHLNDDDYKVIRAYCENKWQRLQNLASKF